MYGVMQHFRSLVSSQKAVTGEVDVIVGLPLTVICSVCLYITKLSSKMQV